MAETVPELPAVPAVTTVPPVLAEPLSLVVPAALDVVPPVAAFEPPELDVVPPAAAFEPPALSTEPPEPAQLQGELAPPVVDELVDVGTPPAADRVPATGSTALPAIDVVLAETMAVPPDPEPTTLAPPAAPDAEPPDA